MLIVLDSTLKYDEGKNRQKQWLAQELNYARTNGLAVVGALHYPPGGDDIRLIESNFTSYSNIPFTQNGNPPTWDDLDSDYCELVQDFMDDGGEFIC